MTDAEKRAALHQVLRGMTAVQFIAETLAGIVLELEADGADMPSLKQAVHMLADIALGWQAGAMIDG